MQKFAKPAVKLLHEALNDDDIASDGFERNTYQDSLLPEIMDGVSIDPEGLRISEAKVRNEIKKILTQLENTENLLQKFESRLDNLETKIKEKEVKEWILAFPLNLHRDSANLLPDELQIDDTRFQRWKRGEWQNLFIPDLDEISYDEPFEIGSQRKARADLKEFLSNSPNNIEDPFGTYWTASSYGRDQRFAVDKADTDLKILLARINYSMQYNKTQRMWIPTAQGNRWSHLRQPFIYLVHNDHREFTKHYYDYVDGTPRKTQKVHGSNKERFQQVFETTPSFAENYPLDSRLKKGFKAYQSGITSRSPSEAFFNFWRALEILTLKQRKESSHTAVNRAENLFNWRQPELIGIRKCRSVRKRNEYVHDETESTITVQDMNLLKLLLDGIIDHYTDRRKEWNVDQMRFCLESLTVDTDQIRQMKEKRSDELEVLEWMDPLANE